jgi:hypothetical protein
MDGHSSKLPQSDYHSDTGLVGCQSISVRLQTLPRPTCEEALTEVFDLVGDSRPEMEAAGSLSVRERSFSAQSTRRG